MLLDGALALLGQEDGLDVGQVVALGAGQELVNLLAVPAQMLPSLGRAQISPDGELEVPGEDGRLLKDARSAASSMPAGCCARRRPGRWASLCVQCRGQGAMLPWTRAPA